MAECVDNLTIDGIGTSGIDDYQGCARLDDPICGNVRGAQKAAKEETMSFNAERVTFRQKLQSLWQHALAIHTRAQQKIDGKRRLPDDRKDWVSNAGTGYAGETEHPFKTGAERIIGIGRDLATAQGPVIHRSAQVCADGHMGWQDQPFSKCPSGAMQHEDFPRFGLVGLFELHGVVQHRNEWRVSCPMVLTPSAISPVWNADRIPFRWPAICGVFAAGLACAAATATATP